MAKKPNRNDQCHCGSGNKYKNCCQGKKDFNLSSKFGLVGIVIALAVGLVLLGFLLSGGDNRPDCPPGTEWSSLHQHCH